MQLVLTNDDGLDAPGLAALADAASSLGTCTVVAPVGPFSGCSHRVTTDGPIAVDRHGDHRYAVHGTPADCVRIALWRLAPRADWVLSGINAGGNLGADVHHSGTVAAVREAVLHGWPGIAISHYRRRGMALDWDRAAAWVPPILRDLMAEPCASGTFWNINLPHLDPDAPTPEVVICPLDTSPLPLSFREGDDGLYYDGDYHRRRREHGSDVDICFGGRIAVTKISLL